jgi:DNA-binding GntR family transcriptional regulator
MAVKTLSDRAYQHLRQSILSGELRPGNMISEATVARELGISRTPVGEAIHRLARDGLVRQVPRYGTIVRPFNREEVIELYEMREALETFAAARAAERITPAALDQLQQTCDIMQQLGRHLEQTSQAELDEPSLRRFLEADMAFHMLIIESAGNRRIMEVVRNMRTLSRVIFRSRRRRHDLRLVQGTHGFHSRILAALRAGQGDEAARHMAEHIRTGRQNALEELERTAAGAAATDDLPQELLDELGTPHLPEP